MSDDSNLSEEQLMNAMKKIGNYSLPDSVPMLPESDVKLSETHRLDVKKQASGLSDDEQVAIRARITDPPSGYVMVMLSKKNHRRLASAMLSDMYDDPSDIDESMMMDTIEEVGNLLISNYVTGLAKHFDSNIDSKAPETIVDPMNELVVKTTKRASSRYAFVFKTGVVVNSDTAVPVYIYHIPKIEELVPLVKELYD